MNCPLCCQEGDGFGREIQRPAFALVRSLMLFQPHKPSVGIEVFSRDASDFPRPCPRCVKDDEKTPEVRRSRSEKAGVFFGQW